MVKSLNLFTMKTTRICVWSGPRNISTALMYSFAQRPDTTVYDEPYYAHYLSRSPARAYHPGADEVIASMENDGESVTRDIVLGPQPTPVAFFKQMTHHLYELDQSFMAQTVNVILTRDPLDMLPSYAKNVEMPTLHDVGYAKQIELLAYLRGLGQDPPILDARLTLQDPAGVLQQLCGQIGIPYDETMLSWAPGPRPEDGCWAKYWYASVHRSTGFQPYTRRNELFPEHLRPLLAACQPYYEQLLPLAITGR